MLISYNKSENLKPEIYDEYNKNPWKGNMSDENILGDKNGRSVAYLGSNNLIKLVYKYDEDRENEATYMRDLKKYKGIPRLYYESEKNNYVIVEHLYDFPNKNLYKYSTKILCIIAYKMINLIETLYMNGIYNNHLRYFTFHDKKDVYFIDNRLWKYIKDDKNGTIGDLIDMCHVLRKFNKENEFVNTIIEYVNLINKIKDKDFSRLRGICAEFYPSVREKDLQF